MLKSTRKQGHGTSQPLLPRRCILVDALDECAPRLVDTRGSRAPYIALSYAWGSFNSSLRLNSATLPQLRQGIDVINAAQHLRDAIHFTQNMGVKYLWIDSVCVDQDNPLEIAEELDCSVEYFSNSFMTISAVTSWATISKSGLKWKSSQRLDIPPYRIVRCGDNSADDTKAEISWAKASRLRYSCFDAVTPHTLLPPLRLLLLDGFETLHSAIITEETTASTTTKEKTEATYIEKSAPSTVAKEVISTQNPNDSESKKIVGDGNPLPTINAMKTMRDKVQNIFHILLGGKPWYYIFLSVALTTSLFVNVFIIFVWQPTSALKTPNTLIKRECKELYPS